MSREDIIARLRENEQALRERGVIHAALFGSRARGNARPESDADILIEIDPAAHIGVWGYAGLKEYIARLFDGEVDVVDREALKPDIDVAATTDAVYAFLTHGKTARRLRDIRHHIALAEGFVANMTYEAFKDDLLRLYAVTRCLEIISEASRRLPDDLKARHPAIAWRDTAASGNIYRHEYEDVAARRVWDTVKHHLPPLQAVILAELPAFDSTS